MRRFGARRGALSASTGPNLSVLVRIGPFANKSPVPLSSLTNATVSISTIVSPTFASPLMYRNLGISADLRLDPSGMGQFIWCEQLTMNATGRIMSNGVDGQDGDGGGATGDGGLGSSGGGGGSAFEAEAGNGATNGEDGQSIDYAGGFGTGAGSGGSYLSQFGLTPFGSGGMAGDGGISVSTGAYYAGAGGKGGVAFAGGGGGGSEDLTSPGASGGGGGGGGRPMVVVGRTLIVTSSFATLFAPGGNGGQGVTKGPYTGGGGGGGGGCIIFCFKRKVFPTGGNINVTGGDGGNGGVKGDGAGFAGTDGSALIYEINHAETTLTPRLWTNTWNNL